MTSTAATRERTWMTLSGQLAFAFTGLHSGRLNLALHIASVPLLLWGASHDSASVLAAGFGLEVVGHVYDYALRFDGPTRWKVLQVVWLQAVGTSVALIFLLWAF